MSGLDCILFSFLPSDSVQLGRSCSCGIKATYAGLIVHIRAYNVARQNLLIYNNKPNNNKTNSIQNNNNIPNNNNNNNTSNNNNSISILYII